MTVYCYNDLISNTILKDFLCDMSATGRMDQLPENLIDAASALSVSGPAYLYMFIEAMADCAVSYGMKREMAYEFCAQSLMGAAKMVLETKKHPGELKYVKRIVHN